MKLFDVYYTTTAIGYTTTKGERILEDENATIDRYFMPHLTTRQDADWVQRVSVEDLSDCIVERRRNSSNHNPGF